MQRKILPDFCTVASQSLGLSQSSSYLANRPQCQGRSELQKASERGQKGLEEASSWGYSLQQTSTPCRVHSSQKPLPCFYPLDFIFTTEATLLLLFKNPRRKQGTESNSAALASPQTQFLRPCEDEVKRLETKLQRESNYPESFSYFGSDQGQLSCSRTFQPGANNVQILTWWWALVG